MPETARARYTIRFDPRNGWRWSLDVDGERLAVSRTYRTKGACLDSIEEFRVLVASCELPVASKTETETGPEPGTGNLETGNSP